MLATLLTLLVLMVSPRVAFAPATVTLKIQVDSPEVRAITVGYIRCADVRDNTGTLVEPVDEDCNPDNPYTDVRSWEIPNPQETRSRFFYLKLPYGFYRAYATARIGDKTTQTTIPFRILESVPQ